VPGTRAGAARRRRPCTTPTPGTRPASWSNSRYDRSRGQAKPEYLAAIDGIFNWTRHFVWTRNEFADGSSSSFAIGGTLSVACLLDYRLTFRDDPGPRRRANAELALRLAANVTWRYLPA